MQKDMIRASYLDWLQKEEESKHEQVRAYRSYYEGDPPTVLNARMAEYLNLDRNKGYGINLCANIVDSVVERLEVTGFTTADNISTEPEVEDAVEEPEGESRLEVLDRILTGWWKANRMDATQDWVHRSALRDRESYVLIGWDDDEKRPLFTHDYTYDGEAGVRVHYKDGSHREVEFASKRWIIQHKGKSQRRLNLYFPDRIEKWITGTPAGSRVSELNWQPFLDEDDPTTQEVEIEGKNGALYRAAVSWWTDTGEQAGEPLGVPVIPFINRDDGTGKGISEIDNAIPIQDGVNKTYIDLMAAADLTGFGMYWTNGVLPANLKIYPGAMINVVAPEGEESASASSIGTLPAGDLSGLIAFEEWQVSILAAITKTPQSQFMGQRVMAAEGSQKQDESALVKKVQGIQKIWGNGWEDVMQMGIKVSSAFGNSPLPDTTGITISANWADPQSRNEKDQAESLKIKHENLKVPKEQIWAEAGYSSEEIEKMLSMDDKEAEKRVQEASVIEQGRNANALEALGRAMGSKQQPAQEEQPREPAGAAGSPNGSDPFSKIAPAQSMSIF